MLACCQETASMGSDNGRYLDLETILSNLPYQPSPPPVTHNAPKMNVQLDLPGYEEYLPTYWPGQKITGSVKIQLADPQSPIKVNHLRIALFGNVQVYGNHPGQPMTNGLFDYQKNEQLINTGLRIVKKSSTPQQTVMETRDNVTQGLDSEEEEDGNILYDERRWRLHCRRDEINAIESDIHPIETGNKKPKSKKKPEDRHMERLIRRVAEIDHTTNKSSGILNDPTCSKHQLSFEESSAFELNVNPSITNNTIAFSILVPTSRRLSGTFEHPHYPISYRIVAIMKCQDKKNSEMICYSTVKLRLEPFVDIHAHPFKPHIQSKPTRHYVRSKNNVLSGVFTFVLSSSSVLTHWLSKMSQKQNKRISPSTDYCSSFIQSHLELPKQAFERSQYVPLQLKLANHASHFKISAIQIRIELVRRINMICSMNEEVECSTVQSTAVIFKSSEEEENEDELVFFKHANMEFDLSKIIQIPENSTCTIFPESTKEVFTLNYDLDVKLRITGVLQDNVNDETMTSILQEPYHYHATHKNIIKHQEDDLSLPKEPYHHKFKTYTMHLEPLTIVVGNSGY
ncbi:hypothetical protein INT48_001651 [Thamnidium elegans]|uniref:Arrestin C-terminal-like domain-containing protein n=1 Tax=Thamnidium elegans TaxID=101142 RepID=A0A8H7SS46_9FUNG|nr:hypothetical protein INT48_001651 [Thamnidium elegans]